MSLSADGESIGGKAVTELFAGVVAGGANVVSGYPFDTVKVRLQAEQGVYKGPWHCFTSILRKEGVRIAAMSAVLSIVQCRRWEGAKKPCTGDLNPFGSGIRLRIRALGVEGHSLRKLVDLMGNECAELGVLLQCQSLPFLVDP